MLAPLWQDAEFVETPAPGGPSTGSGTALPPEHLVKGVSIPAVVSVGAEVGGAGEGVEAGIEQLTGAGGGPWPVKPLEGSEIALEGGAGGAPAAVVVEGGPEVAFGMGKDRLVAVGHERTDFRGGVDVPDFQGVGDGQFHEDVVPFPRQQPPLRAGLGPGFGDEAVFHRRCQLQPDPGPVDGFLQPLASGHDRLRRIRVQPGPMRGAHRPPEAVRGQLPGEEQGLLQRLRAVVEPRQDMAMAVVCGKFFHRCKDKKYTTKPIEL